MNGEAIAFPVVLKPSGSDYCAGGASAGADCSTEIGVVVLKLTADSPGIVSSLLPVNAAPAVPAPAPTRKRRRHDAIYMPPV